MTSFAVPAPRAATGGPSGPVRLLALGFWVVMPTLAVLGIVLALMTWTRHVHDQPAGIPGTYRADARSCSGSLCIPSGTFTSTDHSLVVPDLPGDPTWAQGTDHAVVYDPSSPYVIFPLPGTWDPTAAITALTGAAGLLAVWSWFTFGARRTPHPAPQLA